VLGTSDFFLLVYCADLSPNDHQLLAHAWFSLERGERQHRTESHSVRALLPEQAAQQMGVCSPVAQQPCCSALCWAAASCDDVNPGGLNAQKPQLPDTHPPRLLCKGGGGRGHCADEVRAPARRRSFFLGGGRDVATLARVDATVAVLSTTTLVRRPAEVTS